MYNRIIAHSKYVLWIAEKKIILLNILIMFWFVCAFSFAFNLFFSLSSRFCDVHFFFHMFRAIQFYIRTVMCFTNLLTTLCCCCFHCVEPHFLWKTNLFRVLFNRIGGVKIWKIRISNFFLQHEVFSCTVLFITACLNEGGRAFDVSIGFILSDYYF